MLSFTAANSQNLVAMAIQAAKQRCLELWRVRASLFAGERGWIRTLHRIEESPAVRTITFSRENVRVLAGPPLVDVFVGGMQEYPCTAQVRCGAVLCGEAVCHPPHESLTPLTTHTPLTPLTHS